MLGSGTSAVPGDCASLAGRLTPSLRLRNAGRGAIPRNPATGIRLPKVRGNEPQPLTHTELWQLAEQFDSRRDRVLIVVAGYCGLRWGELAALRWTDIDLDLRRLRVSRVLGRGASRRNVSGERSPGTHRSDPGNCRCRTDQPPGTGRPSELVFPSANFTPLRNRNFRRDSFDAATAAVGLTITPHNLRDTAASLAIQAGASVVAVARLLGHESAATTLNHYAKALPDRPRRRSDTPRCRRERGHRGPVKATSCHWLTDQAPTRNRTDSS
ncbi:tyrosine-type recombinase/integrase [Mycolicibacterium gadium]|uniref:tyrosine-type recombinase/integrase n=1 Tax=Mycolicibacterium gadium TaxID=1794 RepID=UPI00384E3362